MAARGTVTLVYTRQADCMVLTIVEAAWQRLWDAEGGGDGRAARGAHGFDADTLHPGGAGCADAFAIGELEHGTPPSAPTSIGSPREAGRYGVNRGSRVIVSVLLRLGQWVERLNAGSDAV